MLTSSNSRIVIIDYGSGNLHSVYNALNLVKEESQEIIISNKSEDLKTSGHIILPGVGTFADCIEGLQAVSPMIKELKEQVLINKKPFLGICVGMQLLANKGYENKETDGLGFIDGKVIKIEAMDESLKIPHIGWNDLNNVENHPILKGIKNGDHAYFVHSYHFICKNPKNILAKVNYGQNISAVIAKDNIVATQFHPEKSGETGLKLLKNFIS